MSKPILTRRYDTDIEFEHSKNELGLQILNYQQDKNLTDIQMMVILSDLLERFILDHRDVFRHPPPTPPGQRTSGYQHGPFHRGKQ